MGPVEAVPSSVTVAPERTSWPGPAIAWAGMAGKPGPVRATGTVLEPPDADVILTVAGVPSRGTWSEPSAPTSPYPTAVSLGLATWSLEVALIVSWWPTVSNVACASISSVSGTVLDATGTSPMLVT